MSKMARDQNGRLLKGSGGKPAGARNKLQRHFVEALAKDFEEHGEGVLRIVRIERPHEYLKIVAAILPKEFIISDSAIDAMDDAELMTALEVVRKARAEAAEATEH